MRVEPIQLVEQLKQLAGHHRRRGYRFLQTWFGFRFREFAGRSLVPPASWFNAEQLLQASIPDILSEAYVAKYSSPAIRAKARAMGALMRTALDARLQQSSWMSPETRELARRKLAAMQINIGYPDTFQSYSGLKVDDKDLYGDVMRSAQLLVGSKREASRKYLRHLT